MLAYQSSRIIASGCLLRGSIYKMYKGRVQTLILNASFVLFIFCNPVAILWNCPSFLAFAKTMLADGQSQPGITLNITFCCNERIWKLAIRLDLTYHMQKDYISYFPRNHLKKFNKSILTIVLLHPSMNVHINMLTMTYWRGSKYAFSFTLR